MLCDVCSRNSVIFLGSTEEITQKPIETDGLRTEILFWGLQNAIQRPGYVTEMTSGMLEDSCVSV
jgi:hypothetical protein